MAKAKRRTASSASKPRTKSDVFTFLAEDAGVTRRQVSAMFDGLSGLIKRDLSTRGPGMFTLPGLMKITVQKKPATKARRGINPFTGEEMMFKAKPARKVVKVRPLKRLKEMV
jgi:nucleoid DNA-binding protein